jgi:hypothetical protein
MFDFGLIQINDLYLKAIKWASLDEFKNDAIHLLVVILVNSHTQRLSANIDGLLQILFSQKDLSKPYIYEAIIQILRGRYFKYSKENIKILLRGLEEDPSADAKRGDEFVQVLSSRMSLIASFFLDTRRGRIPHNLIEYHYQILKYITATNFNIGIQTIMNLLSLEFRVDMWEYFYIAVKATKDIVDQTSGFVKNSSCFRDLNILTELTVFSQQVETKITRLVQICEIHFGVESEGKSIQPLDVAKIQKTEKLERAPVYFPIFEIENAQEPTANSRSTSIIRLVDDEVKRTNTYLYVDDSAEYEYNVSKWNSFGQVYKSLRFDDIDGVQPKKLNGQFSYELLLFVQVIELAECLVIPNIVSGRTFYQNLLHRSEEISSLCSITIQNLFQRVIILNEA